jgi:ATP-dependent Clp protease ATP-binding subunit ClpC
MDGQYTELARRAVFCARYEAQSHGAVVVCPEHVILGLLRADRQLFELCAPELNVDQIRATLESRLSRRPTVDRKNLIPFSWATRRVLSLAKRESDSSVHPKIGTEHILAGLIRAEQVHTFLSFLTRRSWISMVLRECGVEPNQILQRIRAGQLDWRPKDESATPSLGFFNPIHHDQI